MPDLEFELSFTTPAFAGSVVRGTRPVTYYDRQENECRQEQVPYLAPDPGGIRPPSLRGILEFWHRARHGHLSPEQIFAAQEAVFGSDRAGQGCLVQPVGRPAFHSAKIECEARERRDAFVYLGYGPILLLQSIATSYHKMHCRDAIYPQPAPRFSFRVRGTDEQKDMVRSALILLHLFGGLGARSRRGWGSVTVTADCIDPVPVEGALDRWLTGQLGKAWSAPDAGGTSLPRFSALSSCTQIRLTREVDTWEDVLVAFHKRFKAIRAYKPTPTAFAAADHGCERADAANRARAVSRVPSRLAFGMPYQPGHGWSIEYRGRRRGSADDSDDVTRRASPLLLKVLRRPKGKYFGVALLLRAEFFGDRAREIGATVGRGPSARSGARTLPMSDWTAVEEYMNCPDWTKVDLPQASPGRGMP